MTASPPSPKRIKLDTSLSASDDDDENTQDTNDLEQEHCTICLQSFLDRTIIPVCAHEFCFECILLWSELSRKCPLCSRSFADSCLIHHIRSQYDYQKHYLPPQRSSPRPHTDESRNNALRNRRRERQWGRRQRQQREEADQLERAIARRRWIYQHHLYAKHVASNPYTRYRPFPTPTQFAASPDHIRRMMTFLRRELRVWPNLDVEFLTTYTISLMKSIDIRSESAVKLLSEFLDLDTPYAAGERHVNAEHFAHEIYSYLRSPYWDLNTYDQTAQYDTPPEISPPQEMESSSRWSAGPSPSRRSHSRSNSRYRSPVHHSVIHSPTARHRRDSSAEACEDRLNCRHSPSRSPRGQEDQNVCNYPSNRKHSPSDGVQDTLRNGHSGAVSVQEVTSLTVLGGDQVNNFPALPHFRGDEKENGQATEAMEDVVAARDTPKVTPSQDDDSAAAANEAGATRLIDGRVEGTGHMVARYVDNVRRGSSANPQPSRKRSAGLDVHLHPRNRTLSESIQAYLSQPAGLGYPPKKHTESGGKQLARTSNVSAAPRLLLRLTGGPTGLTTSKLSSSLKTTAERLVDSPTTPQEDAVSKQLHLGRHLPSRVFSSNPASFTRGDHVEDRPTLLDRASGKGFGAADGCPGFGFPPEPGVTSLTRNVDALALEGSLVNERLESIHTPSSIGDAPNGHSAAGTGGEQAGRVDVAAVGNDTDSSRNATSTMSESGSGSCSGAGSGSRSTWTPRSNESGADLGSDVSALERRLRARARVRARLKAIKATSIGGGVGTGTDTDAEGTCRSDLVSGMS